MTPNTEETSGRVEPLLSTALTRRTWALSHLAVTLLGTVMVVVAAGFGTGLTYGLISGDGSQLWRLTLAALAHLPAMMILAAFAYVLIGFMPRAGFLAWIPLAFCFVVMLLGAALRLPTWVMNLSPFTHDRLLPAADFSATSFLVESIVVVGMVLVAYIGLRSRDIKQ